MRNQAQRSLLLLKKRLPKLAESAQSEAHQVLEREPEIMARFKQLADRKVSALRIRTHGDFHLGQVLYTGKDFLIIDFEGEPAKAISERRIKRSPLRDVAGMLRSYHYASYAGFLQNVAGLSLRVQDRVTLLPWARFWYTWVSASFLRSYLRAAGGSLFLPKSERELDDLMTAYLMEKALYEMEYELNSRPEWIEIPLRGVLSLLGEASNLTKS